jgi:hypothetical protein
LYLLKLTVDDQVQVYLLSHAQGEWVPRGIPEGDPACAWWIRRLENHRISSQLLPRAHQPDNLLLDE